MLFSILKFLSNYVLPPKVTQSLGSSRIYRVFTKSFKIEMPSYPDLDDLDFSEFANYSDGNHTHKITTNKLRQEGGISFTPIQHHFVRYYAHGEASLRKFYKEHTPRNILEKHFLFNIHSSGVSTEAHFYFGAPWKISTLNNEIITNKFNQAKEEGLLVAEHGTQGHGPVTEKKIQSEISRLNNIRESIEQNGYKPALYEGDIRGYFLVDDTSFEQDKVFLVTGGQHRAAVLSYLGMDPIPVQFQPNFPRLIKLSDSHNWPLVKHNEVSQSVAINIFLSYFRDGNIRLLDNW